MFLEDFISVMHSFMQTADFFRADNPEGMDARNEVRVYRKSCFYLTFRIEWFVSTAQIDAIYVSGLINGLYGLNEYLVSQCC